ncbi:MAG: ATP-binding cassette domain-containing protein [Desulfobacterota bacterium]|nr:ATP-binding cassette domain-containing protein [Thermodesulfobacteriota bacterium]
MALSLKLYKRVNGFILDVAWTVQEETAVLFGYSGAGKSLTLQMIAGLMRPDRGTIRLEEWPLFDSRAGIDIRPQDRAIGYVFQDLALFPHMTVQENILYGAKGLGKEERLGRTGELIELLHLEGLPAKRPAEISGGQAQRVALARALIRRPKLLLLDEPFSALDNPLRLELQRCLTGAARQYRIPVILVTHDLNEALKLGDRIIVYSQGRVMQAGSPLEVQDNPVIREAGRYFNDGARRFR